MNFTNYREDLERRHRDAMLDVNVRNRITHARCHGVSMEDSDYIIFSPFERYNDDSMMIEAIPLDRMVGTALWGDRVAEALMRLGKQATDLHARLGSASAFQSKHR